MSGAAEQIRDRINKFLAESKEQAKSGLSLPKLSDIFTSLVSMLVPLATNLKLAGAEKKAWVLDYVAKTFDQLAPMIPLPVPLNLFRAPLTALLKIGVLKFADGVIETFYRQLTPAT